MYKNDRKEKTSTYIYSYKSKSNTRIRRIKYFILRQYNIHPLNKRNIN